MRNARYSSVISFTRTYKSHFRKICFGVCLFVFFACLGNPIITPRRILRSQWFHDPWTCGSYSNLGKGCSEQDLDNLMEPLPPKGSKSQVATYYVHTQTTRNIIKGLTLLSNLPLSAPAGVVRWRGNSSLLLLNRPWSCSHRLERS